MKVIVVSGSRDWCDKRLCELVRQELLPYPPDQYYIVHGGCRGVDITVANIAKSLNYKIVEYAANWYKYGRAAGPIRNREMVESECPEMVLLFHPDIESSKGTKDMLNYVRKKGVPHKLCS